MLGVLTGVLWLFPSQYSVDVCIAQRRCIPALAVHCVRMCVFGQFARSLLFLFAVRCACGPLPIWRGPQPCATQAVDRIRVVVRVLACRTCSVEVNAHGFCGIVTVRQCAGVLILCGPVRREPCIMRGFRPALGHCTWFCIILSLKRRIRVVAKLRLAPARVVRLGLVSTGRSARAHPSRARRWALPGPCWLVSAPSPDERRSCHQPSAVPLYYS